jgi:hypothetical protein
VRLNVTPGLRRLALTLHVVSSIGWVGGVACFLALAIAGLISLDFQLVRAGYLAMDLTYRWVVVPLGLASLTTGVVSSLGSEWGLFRYYWILAKLLLTVPAVILMLAHMQPVGQMAGMAAAEIGSGTDLRGLRIQLLSYAVAAVVVLLAATVLSTYKPWGRTGYRTGKLPGLVPRQTRATATGVGPSAGFKVLLAILGVAVAALTAVHLGGLHRPWSWD